MTAVFGLTISEYIIPALWGALGISVLIGFHEFGHFLFCKLFGIRTPSFSIGFGPRIFAKKIGETEFSLSLIPFGGYVEIAGMAEVGQGEQLHRYDDSHSSFSAKPYYQKFLVISGGIIFNLLLSYLIFTYLFLTGVPANSLLQNRDALPVVQSVEAGSPAAEAWIKEGDKIVAINDTPINTIEELIKTMNKVETTTITVGVVRESGKRVISITLASDEITGKIRKKLGIYFASEAIVPQSFFEAVKSGILTTYMWTKNIIFDFVSLFKSMDFKSVAGPIAIIGITAKSAALGYKIVLILLALISINLAVLNVVPLPILDGGQLLFYTIEAVSGRPLPTRVREWIHIVTWILFIILFLHLSINDIRRFFFKP